MTGPTEVGRLAEAGADCSTNVSTKPMIVVPVTTAAVIRRVANVDTDGSMTEWSDDWNSPS